MGRVVALMDDIFFQMKVAESVKLRAAAKDMRVVAFLSHVQKELAQQAKDAGCDEVMPRSSFTQNLAEILSPAKA